MSDDFELEVEAFIAKCGKDCQYCITQAKRTVKKREWWTATWSAYFLVLMCFSFYQLNYFVAGLDLFLAYADAIFMWWSWTRTLNRWRQSKREMAAIRHAAQLNLAHYRQHKWG